MGNGVTLPEKLSEREAMQLAGERFNKTRFDSLKDGNGLISRDQFLTAAQALENNTPRASDIRSVFLKFSPTGEMSSAQFVKMMKDCKLINKKFASGDAEIVFTKGKQAASGGAKVSAGQKVNFDVFCNTCLPGIAEKRGQSVDDIISILAGSSGPTINATHADNVRFHDDKSTYTGTAVQGGPSTGGDGVIHDLNQLLDRSSADVRGVKKPSVTGRADSRAGSRADSTADNEVSRAAATAALAASKTEEEEARERAAVKLQSLGRQVSARAKVATHRYEREVAAGNIPDVAEEKTAAVPEDSAAQIQTVFNKFASSGQMTSAQFVKLVKDCKLVGSGFTTNDAELLFTRSKAKASGGGTVAAGQKVPFSVFQSFTIPAIAEKKGQSVEDICRIIAHSSGPVLHSTQADNVRFHDDKSTYTGTSTQGGPSTGADGAIHDLNQLLDRSSADVRGVKR